MKRSKKKDEVYEELKASALVSLNRLIELRCKRSASCDCADYRCQIFSEALMSVSEIASADTTKDCYYQHLGPIYEDLLLYSLQSGAGKLCELRLHTKNKKQTGSFYTSKDLARFAVEQSLSRLVSDADGKSLAVESVAALRVIDPAMGCGQFLSAALEFLAEKLLSSCDSMVSDMVTARRMVAPCLHGIDLDSGAVAVARHIIALQCQDSSRAFSQALERQLIVGNALTGALHKSGDDSQSVPLTRSPQLDWQHSFPQLFDRTNPGFDAVFGNPPWEIHKPNSREFFQKADANHHNLSKQDALSKQAEMRTDSRLDKEWQEYQNEFRAFSKWISESGNYRLQGSADINAYKLFVELALQIARENGSVTLIVPASLYSDKGSVDLRNAMLHQNDWNTLHGFINSETIFDIHRSFKFCIFNLTKGGSTSSIHAHFSLRNLDAARRSGGVEIKISSVEKFSPSWKSIPEFEHERDIALLEKIARNSVTFGEFAQAHSVQYKREFDMTNDSHLFLPREEAEARGFIPDSFGRWMCGSEVAFPLYEGRMIGHFDVAQKGWASGKGRKAVWNNSADGNIQPQYLIRAADFAEQQYLLKLGFLGVGSATNARSMIAACLGSYPCGNSVPTISCEKPEIILALAACFNSFVFDYVLRLKLAGNNLNYFILQDCFVPLLEKLSPDVVRLVARLNFNPKHFAPAIAQYIDRDAQTQRLTGEARTDSLCALDALVARAYGLDEADLRFILRGCDLSNQERPSNLKGFWRVDKALPSAERQTIRTLRAFEALQQRGSKNFDSEKMIFNLSL